MNKSQGVVLKNLIRALAAKETYFDQCACIDMPYFHQPSLTTTNYVGAVDFGRPNRIFVFQSLDASPCV